MMMGHALSSAQSLLSFRALLLSSLIFTFVGSGDLLGQSIPQEGAANLGADEPRPDVLFGQVRVVDGDSLLLWEEGASQPWSIRLAWLDAPEIGQPCAAVDGSGAFDCGAWAFQALQSAADNSFVRCLSVDRLQDGTLVSTCHLSNAQRRLAQESLNDWLVRSGYAVAFPRDISELSELEATARSAGFGLWQTCLNWPQSWRRAQRSGEVPAEHDHCP